MSQNPTQERGKRTKGSPTADKAGVVEKGEEVAVWCREEVGGGGGWGGGDGRELISGSLRGERKRGEKVDRRKGKEQEGNGDE